LKNELKELRGNNPPFIEETMKLWCRDNPPPNEPSNSKSMLTFEDEPEDEEAEEEEGEEEEGEEEEGEDEKIVTVAFMKRVTPTLCRLAFKRVTAQEAQSLPLIWIKIALLRENQGAIGTHANNFSAYDMKTWNDKIFNPSFHEKLKQLSEPLAKVYQSNHGLVFATDEIIGFTLENLM
jgi:hypothetical protein